MLKEFTIYRDNLNLNILTHLLENPKAILIHLHGLHSTFQYTCDIPDDFSNRVKILKKNNILSYALEFNGHGKSDGKKALINDFDSFELDLNCLIKYIYQYHNLDKANIPIYLLGESMGGAVSIKYAYKYKIISGVILLSPLIKIKNLPNKIICNSLKLMSYIIPSFDLNHLIKKRKGTSNKYYYQELEKNKYNFSEKLSLCSFRECNSFYDWVKDRNLNIPILIFASKNDNFVDYDEIESFFYNSTSKRKEMITYFDENHNLLIPYDDFDILPELILNKIGNWIN